MTAPETPEHPPQRRSRVWMVLAVMAAVAVIAGALAFLTMQESSAGSVAIEAVREKTRAVVTDTTERVAEEGHSLEVSWGAVPAPAGPGHMVVARLKLRPSGSVEEARFVVVHEQITPQNALARSLLQGAARG